MAKVIKTKSALPLIQLPFRCNEQLRARLHRAMGREMTRTGERISANDLLIRLIDEGLARLGE